MKKALVQTSIALAPAGGPTLTFMGMMIAYKISGADWALLEVTLPPRFSGLPLHWHKRTQHGFYVLQGRAAFQLDRQVFSAEAGAFVHVPPLTVHTVRNPHEQPACLLEVFIPGGAENSFKELVALTQSEPAALLKPQTLLDLYSRYDTFLPEENQP